MINLNKKLISIITPCFNEEGNIMELHHQIAEVMKGFPQYCYEHVLIDNASTDSTQELIRRMAKDDPNVRAIFNIRNFGQLRSPYYALLQVRGDAVVVIAADLQDPPQIIGQYLKQWENGFLVVLGEKISSSESGIMFQLRKMYYKIVNNLSEVELLQNVTGAGLYDRIVVEALREMDDPYPYVRGLISELGYPVARIPFHQPKRKSGITKNNWFTLYDIAVLGFTSHSKIPLRLAAITGFTASILSLLIAICYLIYKLLFWGSFPVGMAPVVIGLFFFSSVQLLFIGIIGEYIGVIHGRLQKRPLVIERERINFNINN